MSMWDQSSERTGYRLRNWAGAIQQRDFAAIADWFTSWFFGTGIAILFAAAIAAGVDQGVTGGIPVGIAAGCRVFALSLLFGAASIVSGWLLGLLFGVPRSLARDQLGAPSTAMVDGSTPAAQTGQAAALRFPSSRVNTNLEDISDWLTKTIVGVGLTQLFTVPGFLWSAAEQVNTAGFGWAPYGRLLALALFFYFAPGGFWLGYVGTRTILTKLFDFIDAPAAQMVTEAGNPQHLRLDPSAQVVQQTDALVAQADSALLGTPLRALITPREIAAWGAAQARAGNLEAARSALEDAFRSDPGNPDVRKQLATVYAALKRYAEADRLVRDVPNTDLAVLTALYEPAPGGFLKAISIGEELLARGGQEKNANLHVWMACAYGQQHAFEKARGAGAGHLVPIKNNVLREIRAAIAADPTTRSLLHSFWKAQPGAQDNDLASFDANDPDLTQLLEQP